MSVETMVKRGAYIAGAAEPYEGEGREIRNPGTGDLVARVTSATEELADRAVHAARDAFAAWARLSYTDRGKILHACAEAFEAHVNELTPILVAEQGKTIREAKIELHKAAETLEHYAGMAREVRGISVHGLDPGVDGRVIRRPLGVVAAIVPWNFPTTLLCNKLGPAFLCGNTVVAKPADTTPLTTLRLAEIFTEAGLPPGVFNVVPGRGSVVGEALVTHPLVRKVAFTGSTPVGERVAALAAVGSKRVTLELGGSDPMIICDDADLGAAASAASMGRFYNCGQACLAIKRVYVFESVADEVIEAIGAKAAPPPGWDRQRPRQPDGSPAHRRAAPGARAPDRRDPGPWRRAVDRRTPADRRGSTPTAGFTSRLSSSTHPQTRRWRGRRCSARRCRFGACRDMDEALALANDSEFGLGSSVWTQDLDRAERAAAELDCGYTWINSRTKVYDELPFGGLKSSGYGKEHGSEAVDFYTDKKSVVVRRG